jgi:RNA polymerase sigma-70 factor (ECF subfamily)
LFVEPFRPPGAILNELDHGSDAALVDAMRRGDEDAFAALYAAHQPPLYRYALQMCGAAAADDVVQETFMALLRGERFDPRRGTLQAYAFGIARHHILRRLSLTRLESPADEGTLAETAAGDIATAFDEVSRAELVSLVREAIATLPAAYREAIVLCELQEMDYATAADVMRCPVGTVRSRLHRAKALLYAKLGARKRVLTR